MAKRKFNFNVENLESRQMMAGDVTAVLQGSSIILSEAAGHIGEASQVQVSQLANGNIRVAGYTNNGAPSPINGGSFVDFAPVAGLPLSLTANLGGGNDRFVVANGVKLNQVALNLGGAGSDVDTVDIQGLNTRGSLFINTGPGVDQINMDRFQIGDGVGADELNISTGFGRDSVTVGTLNNWTEVRGNVLINTFAGIEKETDFVTVNLLTVSKDLRINTGDGEDQINMLATTVGQDIVIDSGEGKDTVTLREVQAIDEFFVTLGGGDDTLNLNFVRARWFKAEGGEGVDTLVSQNPSTTEIQFIDFSYFNGHKILPDYRIDPAPVSVKLA